MIFPTPEVMYCFCFIFWCLPNNTVNTGGSFAIIFRHSSNGENFAAVGVGQETLQGFHLVPSTRLRCLHDTHLESANVAVNGLPVNGIPLCRFARDRTNSLRRCQPSSGTTLRSPRPLRTVRDGFPITRLKPFERLFQGDAAVIQKG